MTRFVWDPAKNRKNVRKHGVSLETASLIFADQWIVSRRDVSHDDAEERFNALGEIAPGVILFVVFTWREDAAAEEVIRLISARGASSHEKRIYEEARSRAEAGHRQRRRQDRRYD